jgi:signal peptidase I
MRHPLRVASLLAVAAAAAAAWFLLAPLELGGSTSYAVVYGTSMEPHLHRGDLVVLRRRPAYRPGEVVGYRSHELHRNVLHRIVSAKNGRFAFKGDNNAFLDPEQPTASQLFGQEWIVVPHAGALLERLRTPRDAAIAAGLAVLLLVGTGPSGIAGRRRRRPSPQAPAPALVPPPAAPPAPSRARTPGLPAAGTALAVAGVVVLALAAALAVAAFRQPAQHVSVDPGLYVQRGAFSWSAPAPVGAVYQARSLRPRDPVYLRLVHRLAVRFDYRIRPRAPFHLSGSGSLDAVLSDGDGWRRRFPLVTRRSFGSTSFSLRGMLDVRAVAEAVRRFEAQTGVHNPSYHVAIAPHIRVHGLAGGRAIRDSFSPALALELDAVRLRLATVPPDGEPNTLVRTRATAATRTVPGVVALPGGRLGVPAARRTALALAGTGVALVLAGALLVALGRRRDEVAAIVSRYGDLIVRIAAGSRAPVVERRVESIEALVRLAERYDRVILHEERDGLDSFVVEDAGFAYRYDVGTPPEDTLELDALPAASPIPIRAADR